MRVSLVTTGWPVPPTSGEAAIVYPLIRYLGHRHELHLITLTASSAPNLPEIDELASHTCIYCPRNKSIIGYFRHLWRKYPYGIYATTHPSVGNGLNAAVKAQSPDLVQVCSLGLSLYQSFLPAGLPRVLLAADSLSLVMSRLAATESNPILKAHYKLHEHKAAALERCVYPGFDSVVLVSGVDAEIVKRNSPGSRIQVINNGVDTQFFSPSGSKHNRQLNLGLVGNYGYKPNERAALRLLRDIFPRVSAKFPDARAFAIGSNPSKAMKEVERRIHGTVVTGFVKDIRPYLEQLSVFVAFLEAGGGIKNKVLEAMSMGLPVIGTRVAFEGIDGLPGKHFICVDNIEDAVAKIERLLQDDMALRTIGRAARALVEAKYSWAAKAAEYESFWQATIDNYGL